MKFLYSDTFKSFLHTFFTDLVWDLGVGATFGHLISGDFSTQTFMAFGYAIFRTFFRAVREFLELKYPKQMPLVNSDQDKSAN